ncbi:MAG: hypothetical protein ACKV2V_07170 [Blastocatellia bacterium]
MKPYTLSKVNLLTGLIAIVLLAGAVMGIHTSAIPASGQQPLGRRVGPAQTIPAPAEQTAAEAEPEEAAEMETQKDFTIPGRDTRPLRFDISENATRFVFDETPLHADGAPAYGNEFVTEGYIYAAGTLSGTDGVNPDGSPQYPDKVIGRWTCRGWHTGDGAKTITGPWVVTHQVYDLGRKPGQQMLVSDGLELVDLNEPILRAISGGTGPYAHARGEIRQTMIGFNQLNGANLRVEVRAQYR